MARSPPSKTCHSCHQKIAGLDVNRKLPPLPTSTHPHVHQSNSIAMGETLPAKAYSPSPTKSGSSGSSASKKSHRVVVQQQILESLQPEPAPILRSTDRRYPELVDEGHLDGISNSSREVPVMISEEIYQDLVDQANINAMRNAPHIVPAMQGPSANQNTLRGNPFQGNEHAAWDWSPSTNLGGSSSQESSQGIWSCKSESEVPLFQKNISHSGSESHIENDDSARDHRHVHFSVSEPNQAAYNQSPSPVRGRPRERAPVSGNLAQDDVFDDIDIFNGSPKKGSGPSHKKLFGEKGWLGRSPNDEHRKTGLKKVGEMIKQRVEDWMADASKGSPKEPQSPPSSPRKSTLSISLDAPSQAKMYAEIEVMICTIANKFLVDQFHKGRMSMESIKKITNFWTSKNRAPVTEFQFDQVTQRELVAQNFRTLEFHGECAYNPVALKSTLDSWKSVGNEMSVRTFCYPDSVIRKHMYDTHKILEMLGADFKTLCPFEYLQMTVLGKMTEHRRKKSEGSDGNGSPRSRGSHSRSLR